jgi:DNA-binding PadR family transcriptional regulator
MEKEKGKKTKEGIDKKFFKNEVYSSMLKIIILSKLKKRKFYAYSLLKEISKNTMIKNHFNVNNVKLKNDVYNTMRSLESSGYIKIYEINSNAAGKSDDKKAYYILTKQGAEILFSIKKIFINAAHEIKKII